MPKVYICLRCYSVFKDEQTLWHHHAGHYMVGETEDPDQLPMYVKNKHTGEWELVERRRSRRES